VLVLCSEIIYWRPLGLAQTKPAFEITATIAITHINTLLITSNLAFTIVSYCYATIELLKYIKTFFL